jgi:hypothetical protein
MRWVRDGETVSGNGELLVFDGIGAGHGRLICRIVGFHQASVTVVDRAIELTDRARRSGSNPRLPHG